MHGDYDGACMVIGQMTHPSNLECVFTCVAMSKCGERMTESGVLGCCERASGCVERRWL